jgi:hypothetical protein
LGTWPGKRQQRLVAYCDAGRAPVLGERQSDERHARSSGGWTETDAANLRMHFGGEPVSEQTALEAYDRLLSSIGNHAGAIGTSRLPSHWPHVGTNHRGLVVAGQALQGWDPAVTGARWPALDATTAHGRASMDDDEVVEHFD